MYERVTPHLIRSAESHHEGYWIAAILLYGVGDLVTTGIGLGTAGVAEIGPLAAPLIQQFGIGAMVAVKLAALGAFYAVWRIVPRPYCLGVPLGLAFLGTTVTAWNLYVLSIATVA